MKTAIWLLFAAFLSLSLVAADLAQRRSIPAGAAKAASAAPAPQLPAREEISPAAVTEDKSEIIGLAEPLLVGTPSAPPHRTASRRLRGRGAAAASSQSRPARSTE